MNSYVTAFKREFWEHKGVFVLLPLVIAGLLIIAMLFAVLALPLDEVTVGGVHIEIDLDEQPAEPGGSDAEYVIDFAMGEIVAVEGGSDELSPEEQHAEEINATLNAVHWLFMAIAGFVVFFYLLHCLFNDRKDRSILFWKSMPVSETVTVGTKFITGGIMVSLVVTAISWVVQICFLPVIMIFFYRTGLEPWNTVWAQADILGNFAHQLFVIFWVFIWSLPFNAWFIFSSALARRSPFLMALIPPVAAILFEWLLFDTTVIARWIGAQLVMIGLQSSTTIGGSTIGGVGDGQSYMNIATGNLMGGCIIAALLLAGTVWLRNYRFEI